MNPFFVSYVGKRLWWPKQSPNNTELTFGPRLNVGQWKQPILPTHQLKHKSTNIVRNNCRKKLLRAHCRISTLLDHPHRRIIIVLNISKSALNKRLPDHRPENISLRKLTISDSHEKSQDYLGIISSRVTNHPRFIANDFVNPNFLQLVLLLTTILQHK